MYVLKKLCCESLLELRLCSIFYLYFYVFALVCAVNRQSNGEGRCSIIHSGKTTGPILIKLETSNYTPEATRYANFDFDTATSVYWGNRQFATVFFLSYFLFSLPRSQVALYVRSRSMRAFGGLNDVPQNFGGKIPPKNWNFGAVNRTFKPEREKNQILITWKLRSRSWQSFYRRYAPRMRLRGWSHGSPKQIQDGGGHHL